MSSEIQEVSGFTLMEGEEVHHNVRPSLVAWMSSWLRLSLGIVTLGVLPFLFTYSNRYVVTDERVLKKTGLLRTNTEEYRIDDIQQLTTGQRIVEKLLGVGNIQFKTAATGSSIKFLGMKDQDEIANTIRNQMR